MEKQYGERLIATRGRETDTVVGWLRPRSYNLPTVLVRGLRDYGLGKDALGLEKTPEVYVQHLVEIFREIRRVLRDDGVIFLNLGDSFAAAGYSRQDNTGGAKRSDGGKQKHTPVPKGLKPLDRCDIPGDVARALRADGWFWRQTIIWEKLNPMPESVNGWFFTAHRVKIKDHEKMLHLWQRKHPGKDWPFKLPRLPQEEIPDSETTLSTKPQGEVNSTAARGTARCSGEETNVFSVSTGKSQSTEIPGNREGQNNPPESFYQIQPQRKGQTISSQSKRKRSVSSENPGTSNESKTVLSTVSSKPERESKQCATGSQETRLAKRNCESFNSDSMARDSTSEQESLLLLQEKGEINHRSCDPIEQGRGTYGKQYRPGLPILQLKETHQNPDTVIDCPGCERCADNDGLVLRKGSWRPSSAHEYIFMLTKTASYFCDAEAGREPAQYGYREQPQNTWNRCGTSDKQPERVAGATKGAHPETGRNLRSVWTFPSQPLTAWACLSCGHVSDPRPKRELPDGRVAHPCPSCHKEEVFDAEGKVSWTPWESHFASFPEKLPEICIRAGSSEAGCCAKCGAPWSRIVERKTMVIRRTDWGEHAGNRTASSGTMLEPSESKTLGWRQTC